ncbi:hypothetical protein A2572_02685 [Candidatus Collierbacteria bacterium RIFOXYD1_FULL_40_9]|uniref:Nucleoside 2-deoxyribosyltransferase n=1 Tax=Candidatus Collierbacteria bacterium RIFOXYD1_FULL_40_9 TaxID=1817731 RepID=A0A1F5FW54_9BACT|nr:MAG: hypothetical protein A2572_02685 [Candidatus Collierbacteria bacterium RIFOXYD1_FULL_40_9]
MKVLFQASILHRNERMEDYVAIVQCLEKCGCEVLGETLVVSNDLILKRGHVDRVKYFERFKKNLLEADLVCFEATYPSTLHVGIKLAFALQKGKPVIVLYKKTSHPESFVDVFESGKLFYEEYTANNLDTVIKSGLEFIEKNSDVRFNFYLPSEQMDYLDRVRKDKSLTRTAVLRKIIDEAMGRSEVSWLSFRDNSTYYWV